MNDKISGSPLHAGAVVSRAYAPSTAGEFIQGYLDDQPFLVNCPINLWSIAEATSDFSPNGRAFLVEGLAGVSYQKTAAAISYLYRHPEFARYKGLGALLSSLKILTHIPRGKGLASSSSEMAAAVGALLGPMMRNVDLALLSEIFCSIEPTDLVHLPGVNMINQFSGTVYNSYRAPQGMDVVLVDMDPSGTVQTDRFDREKAIFVARARATEMQTMVDMMNRGLRTQDLRCIGEAATLSSVINQDVLRKPSFESLRSIVNQFGALGVTTAHTGTVMGVLLQSDHDSLALETEIAKRLEGTRTLGRYKIESGGIRFRDSLPQETIS